jgi:hypothetical protein
MVRKNRACICGFILLLLSIIPLSSCGELPAWGNPKLQAEADEAVSSFDNFLDFLNNSKIITSVGIHDGSLVNTRLIVDKRKQIYDFFTTSFDPSYAGDSKNLESIKAIEVEGGTTNQFEISLTNDADWDYRFTADFYKDYNLLKLKYATGELISATSAINYFGFNSSKYYDDLLSIIVSDSSEISET